MKYLVESHIGGFYISEGNIESIEKPCENGERNVVVFSYEGNLIKALKQYFSKILLTEEELIKMIEEKYSDISIIDNINYRYDLNKITLDCLLGSDIINFEEKMRLTPIILNSQKNNLLLYNCIKFDKRQSNLKINKIIRKIKK